MKYTCIVYQPAIRPTSTVRIGPVFLTAKDINMLPQNLVLIKVYPLHYSESFHPSLLLFLFKYLAKCEEIATEVLINRNSLDILCHIND